MTIRPTGKETYKLFFFRTITKYNQEKEIKIGGHGLSYRV